MVVAAVGLCMWLVATDVCCVFEGGVVQADISCGMWQD